jgi:hypothetical protein
LIIGHKKFNLFHGTGQKDLKLFASLCKSMLAIPVGKKARLFQFDCNGVPEQCRGELPFAASGLGTIADPFL